MTDEQKRIIAALVLAVGVAEDLPAVTPDTAAVVRAAGRVLAEELCLDEMLADSPEYMAELLGRVGLSDSEDVGGVVR